MTDDYEDDQIEDSEAEDSTSPPPSNVTAETALHFHARYAELDSDLADGLEQCRSVRRRIKSLRKEIEAAGIDLKGWDRARADAQLSASERESLVQEHRRQLEWLKKPIGFQATLDPPQVAFTADELSIIEIAGYNAGKSNQKRDANPQNAGTDAHVAWDNGWMKAQKDLAEEMGEAPASTERRRGRRPNVTATGRA